MGSHSLGSSEIRDLRKNMSGPLALVDGRLRDLQCWKDRAEALLPATDRELRAIPDAALRRLLRGGPDYADLKLGSFTHVKLYDELLEASACADRSLAHALHPGFPIVGPIQRSGRWPAYPKPQDPVQVSEAESRAWEFRKKIFRRCSAVLSAVPVSDNLCSLWKSTMEDVAEGSTVGPLSERRRSDSVLGLR